MYTINVSHKLTKPRNKMLILITQKQLYLMYTIHENVENKIYAPA